jgi:glucan 1,3-beta-glucosidase
MMKASPEWIPPEGQLPASLSAPANQDHGVRRILRFASPERCIRSRSPVPERFQDTDRSTEESCDSSAEGSASLDPRPGPWRGVSLGGWLLLEPGPSWPLFRRLANDPALKPPEPNEEDGNARPSESSEPIRCEWEFMRRLRRAGPAGLKALEEHRETFITRNDFEKIRDLGLNAVRIPFGYWIVLGSTRGFRKSSLTRGISRTVQGSVAKNRSVNTASKTKLERRLSAPASPMRHAVNRRTSISAKPSITSPAIKESSRNRPSTAPGKAVRKCLLKSLKQQSNRIYDGERRWRLSEPDPFEGPALQYLDRAVAWAEEFGLQVLLDLHGAPGGESAEAPSGRRQRPPTSCWDWKQWRFEESLQALRLVARRYRNSKVVTGIAVCNEPSHKVPSDVLCRFYDRAVRTVRRAGLRASSVTVVLPVFQRALPPFVEEWESMGGNIHENIAFEVHWYHCFENEWHGRTFAQHLRAVQEHADELRRYPIVVGEWSLALGCAAKAQAGKRTSDQLLTIFADAQLAAYREASHGWFFWSWSDHPNAAEWDWQQARAKGLVPNAESLLEDLPSIPAIPLLPSSPLLSAMASPRPTRRGPLREPPRYEVAVQSQDPLEAVFDPAPADMRVRFGDTVYLRAFHGRYLDVEGPRIRARYGDRGKWQQFLVCPYLGTASFQSTRSESSFAAASSTFATALGSATVTEPWQSPVQVSFEALPLKDRDVICLRAHTGRFLGVNRRQVSADFAVADSPQCAFVVRTIGRGAEVKHRSPVFLQNLATSKVIAPNESDPGDKDNILARWKNFGEWQRLVVEKPVRTAVTPHRPRRRTSLPGTAMPLASPPTFQLPPSTPNRSRVSVGGCEASVNTPMSRRKSTGGLADVELIVSTATPSRKRRSSIEGCESVHETPASRRKSVEGLADVQRIALGASPVRRRRSSIGGAEAVAVWPEGKELEHTFSALDSVIVTPARRSRNSVAGACK